MDLRQVVQVFGFGSYFRKGTPQPNDIDILLLHSDFTTTSLNFVIECKKRIIQQLPRAHVSMLSLQEEMELDFINKSRAEIIGIAAQETTEQDISSVIHKIYDARRYQAR